MIKAFNTLMDWFHDAIAFASDAIDGILNFMSPLANAIAKSGGSLLTSAAYAAVIAAEQKGGSGQEKFDAAKTAVIAYLTKNSMPYILTAVHGALEAAVARLNAQADAVAPASAPSETAAVNLQATEEV